MEYGNLAAKYLPAMGAFTATGTPFSVAAGRISFTFGFKGPSVSLSALVGDEARILLTRPLWMVVCAPILPFQDPLYDVDDVIKTQHHLTEY